MPWKSLLTAAAAGTLIALSMSTPAAAFGRCKLERSAGPDPHMWRYCKARYYPAAREMYWVPAKHMRYRWRYQFYGPEKYVYHPAWGHPATSGVVAYEKRGYYYRWHLW